MAKKNTTENGGTAVLEREENTEQQEAREDATAVAVEREAHEAIIYSEEDVARMIKEAGDYASDPDIQKVHQGAQFARVQHEVAVHGIVSGARERDADVLESLGYSMEELTQIANEHGKKKDVDALLLSAKNEDDKTAFLRKYILEQFRKNDAIRKDLGDYKDLDELADIADAYLGEERVDAILASADNDRDKERSLRIALYAYPELSKPKIEGPRFGSESWEYSKKDVEDAIAAAMENPKDKTLKRKLNEMWDYFASKQEEVAYTPDDSSTAKKWKYIQNTFQQPLGRAIEELPKLALASVRVEGEQKKGEKVPLQSEQKRVAADAQEKKILLPEHHEPFEGGIILDQFEELLAKYDGNANAEKRFRSLQRKLREEHDGFVITEAGDGESDPSPSWNEKIFRTGRTDPTFQHLYREAKHAQERMWSQEAEKHWLNEQKHKLVQEWNAYKDAMIRDGREKDRAVQGQAIQMLELMKRFEQYSPLREKKATVVPVQKRKEQVARKERLAA